MHPPAECHHMFHHRSAVDSRAGRMDFHRRPSQSITAMDPPSISGIPPPSPLHEHAGFHARPWAFHHMEFHRFQCWIPPPQTFRRGLEAMHMRANARQSGIGTGWPDIHTMAVGVCVRLSGLLVQVTADQGHTTPQIRSARVRATPLSTICSET